MLSKKQLVFIIFLLGVIFQSLFSTKIIKKHYLNKNQELRKKLVGRGQNTKKILHKIFSNVIKSKNVSFLYIKKTSLSEIKKNKLPDNKKIIIILSHEKDLPFGQHYIATNDEIKKSVKFFKKFFTPKHVKSVTLTKKVTILNLIDFIRSLHSVNLVLDPKIKKKNFSKNYLDQYQLAEIIFNSQKDLINKTYYNRQAKKDQYFKILKEYIYYQHKCIKLFNIFEKSYQKIINNDAHGIEKMNEILKNISDTFFEENYKIVDEFKKIILSTMYDFDILNNKKINFNLLILDEISNNDSTMTKIRGINFILLMIQYLILVVIFSIEINRRLK